MIKNFIYLDEPKLYSFSSQLFEGITEYVLNEEQLDKKNKDTSTPSSSRVIADVIRETSSSTTKKFLHDHSFNLFEKELIASDLLLNLDESQLTYDKICQSNKSFIRIKAKGKFIDLRGLQHFLANFNEIGEAVAALPLTSALQEIDKLKASNPKSIDAKNLQSKIDKEIKLQKANGKGLPSISIKNFNTILEHFGDDIIRFEQIYNGSIFTSCLNSNYLRDSLIAIYRKYSRKTAKEFVVIGTISHADGTQDINDNEVPDDAKVISHFKHMGESLYEMEQIFTGKTDNEIIIEPIAIYTEI
ncbi:hypothetical protein A6D98_05965 [Aliivibrio fischeri]|uniref:DUF6414 family protein n=1 Tax=Aliivibrio fischeri TaxID=668 RepID=UPI00080E5CEE|nr:hypothetical protein [Aliivibrio fischeri]OCH05913.1 hypothetical protein A6E10_07555 [Aliivibrio fischeri]OCH27479.1 hypothetical protein A6E13_06950 [Aliivibrio fischeri]OCH62544.1 hypothetical protein A6D98_05965 [Aliivibrio fischeri]